jgi:hypothetical protein
MRGSLMYDNLFTYIRDQACRVVYALFMHTHVQKPFELSISFARVHATSILSASMCPRVCDLSWPRPRNVGSVPEKYKAELCPLQALLPCKVHVCENGVFLW